MYANIRKQIYDLITKQFWLNFTIYFLTLDIVSILEILVFEILVQYQHETIHLRKASQFNTFAIGN